MHEWQPDRVARPDEVQVVTARRSGGTPRITTIWIVAEGNRVFIRSTNGPTAAWYRAASTDRAGRILTGGQSFDVVFTPAGEPDLAAADSGYRRKYGRYASVVDHLLEPGPRSATLLVEPA